MDIVIIRLFIIAILKGTFTLSEIIVVLHIYRFWKARVFKSTSMDLYCLTLTQILC